MRCVIELAVGAAMLFVAGSKFLWLSERWAVRGHMDYWYIAATFAGFIALVYWFDRYAEEAGLIVQHWWED